MSLVLFLTACADDPIAPEPCTLAPVLAAQAIPDIPSATLQVALADAATRATLAFPAGPEVRDLRTVLISLLAGGTASNENACRAIRSARELLAALPTDAGSQPDRAVISLALDLTETALAAR